MKFLKIIQSLLPKWKRQFPTRKYHNYDAYDTKGQFNIPILEDFLNRVPEVREQSWFNRENKLLEECMLIAPTIVNSNLTSKKEDEFIVTSDRWDEDEKFVDDISNMPEYKKYVEEYEEKVINYPDKNGTPFVKL